MKSFRTFLREGSSPKYKVGTEPKFINKSKQEIADRLRDFVKSNKNTIYDIHYDAGGKESGTFKTNSLTTVKITDRSVVKKLARWMNIFDVEAKGDRVKVTNNGVSIVFQFSSGKGFFFQGEGKQTIPKTDQQEMGTIKTLEFWIQTKKYPTNNQINQIVGFNFSEDWYNSFINHSNAIRKAMNITSGHKIELDSDASSIGSQIFSLLKKKHKLTASNDNWNPADIWIYKGNKKSAMMAELDTTLSVLDFNAKIKQFFEAGWLWGVSLKKATKPTTAKIIDSSKAKPVVMKYAPTEYNILNTYYDIKTTGYPPKFMIRTRAKAKSIANKGDIKIYFEGKIENSSEFLGAVDKKLVMKLINANDTVAKDITVDDVMAMAKKVQSKGHMKVTNLDKINTLDDMKLTYIYVMLRYAFQMYSASNDTLKKLAMAGFKMNDFSSIHYKVGG